MSNCLKSQLYASENWELPFRETVPVHRAPPTSRPVGLFFAKIGGTVFRLCICASFETIGMTGLAGFFIFAEIDAIGENRGVRFCDSATFGSKERFYTLKIDNKDVTWYNK